MPTIDDLLNFAANQQPTKFAAAFDDIMGEKTAAAIETMRTTVAQGIYDAEDDAEDTTPDEDDIDQDEFDDVDDDIDDEFDDVDDLELDDDDLNFDDSDLEGLDDDGEDA